MSCMQTVVSGFAVMAGCAIALILLDSAYRTPKKQIDMTGSKLQDQAHTSHQQAGGQRTPMVAVVV